MAGASSTDDVVITKQIFYTTVDDSGVIRRENFENIVRKLGPDLLMGLKVGEAFDIADADNDGVVGFTDFAQFVQDHDAGRRLRKGWVNLATFEPRHIPGFRITQASEADDLITKQLVADPIFHGGNGNGLDNVRSYTARASLGPKCWEINVATVQCPPGMATGKVALFMHGHGHSCCLSTWGRFWGPMLTRGFHLLAFDAPGFGRSSGTAGQTIPWRQWDAELVLMLLEAFQVMGKGLVSVFGQCMGGAMFLRVLERSPDTFSGNHVLHNCTIGTWPVWLSDVVDEKGGGLRCFWWCDPDHMRESNVYREFKALAAKDPYMCQFVDLQHDREPAFFEFFKVPSHRLSRSGHGGSVLGFCQQAVGELSDFVASPARPSTKFTASTASKKTMLELGMDNDDFKVFIRIRPFIDRERGLDACCEVFDVEDPRGRRVQQIFVRRDEAGREMNAEHVFERVFALQATQEDVCNAVMSSIDVVESLFEGIGSTIFAYGQTGSGKTYTIDGNGSGIIATVVSSLFHRLPKSYCVCAQYVQLYNEQFLDLFDPPSRVAQDGSGNLVGSKVTLAATAEELMHFVVDGAAFRASARTGMNEMSSRSHAILSLQLRAFDSQSNAPGAKLFIVDLAGSERVKKSGVSGANLAEAVAINQSLFALIQVTSALVENRGRPRAHVPYRDSALTRLLQNSLGGNARTILIACISPSVDSASETAGTLRFAACATHVLNRTAKAQKETQDAEQDKTVDKIIDGNSVDFSLGHATIATSAGNVFCYGNFDAGPDTPVVVMVHYFDRKHVTGEMWKYTFETIKSASCRYLAPDMPGHGNSSGDCSSKPEDYCSQDGPVDVLRQLLDVCGVKRAILLGYDWGGGVVCSFAAHHPARARKIILWCASVRNPQELEKLKPRAKLGDIKVLWAKNDNWHPYRKGSDMATALGAKVTEVRLRSKGGTQDALDECLAAIAISD